MDVVASEGLRHNPRYAVTRSIERVTLADGGHLVRKVLQRDDPSASPHWQASDDPRRWSSWRREADAYRSEALARSVAGTGLALASADVVGGDARDERDGEVGGRRGEASGSPDRITLWLEAVEGRPGTEFDLDDHRALALALGRWQARPPTPEPWWSRRFLRDYSASKPVDLALVDRDAAWAQPVIAAAWDPALRDGWRRVLAHRERLLRIAEALPRTLAHLDVWPANELRRPDGEVVLVDWAFAGDGALGEDLGNHVPDSTFDLFWPGEQLPTLDQELFASYVDGLRDGGWRGDEREVRLGVTASCVKYAWLLPHLLADASADAHVAYGTPAASDHLYAERGLGLGLLVRWCDEALALADQLGR